MPYLKPFRQALNYLEYEKKSNPNAHVQIFEAIIKANGEMINEKIVNIFNFTLKDNASNWCNNYMQNHPKWRFAYL
jgi:hypothetical protein